MSIPSPGARQLYLYFDEAGDLNFKSSGTTFFMFGALSTRDPWPLTEALGALRKELYEGTFIPEHFHASNDLQYVRDEVFETIRRTGGFTYDVLVVEKRGVPGHLQPQHEFYTFVADVTLNLTLQHYPGAEPIYVITDKIPVQRKRSSVTKGFKQSLVRLLDGRRYQIGHHSSAAHPCLQAADYMNWAVFRKWERDDWRSYDLIKNFVRLETQLDWDVLK